MLIMRQFEAEEWMSLVQNHRADRAMLVPTMLKHVMEHPKFEEFDLSSLDVITYGAAPMPMEVIRDAINKFPEPGLSMPSARPRRPQPSPCCPGRPRAGGDAGRGR